MCRSGGSKKILALGCTNVKIVKALLHPKKFNAQQLRFRPYLLAKDCSQTAHLDICIHTLSAASSGQRTLRLCCAPRLRLGQSLKRRKGTYGAENTI